MLYFRPLLADIIRYHRQIMHARLFQEPSLIHASIPRIVDKLFVKKRILRYNHQGPILLLFQLNQRLCGPSAPHFEAPRRHERALIIRGPLAYLRS